jgi:isopenicillin-N epimerase
MAAIPLGRDSSGTDVAVHMRQALTRDHRIVAPIYGFGGQIWIRISAQIYNQIEDYRACSEALIKLRAEYDV